MLGIGVGVCFNLITLYKDGSIVPAVFDSFDRETSLTSLGVSDSGHEWISLEGVWGIENNTARLISGSEDAKCFAIIDSGLSDSIIKVRYAEFQNLAGLCFRMSDVGNGFYVYGDSRLM